MSILLAATGGGTPAPSAEPDPLVLSSSVHIHFDGNSITSSVLTADLPSQVSAALAGARNGAVITGNAIPGEGWVQLRDNPSDVHNSWDPTKTNVLVVNEETNSVFNQGMTVAQTITARQTYLDTVRSVHPWIILLWGSIPRGHADETLYPGEVAMNARLVEIEADTAANWAGYGVHGFVTMRDIPQYAHNGSSAAAFGAFQSAWFEDPANPPAGLEGTNWNGLGWTHPLAGEFPGGIHPMGTGKRAIAAKIATALTNGSLPALP